MNERTATAAEFLNCLKPDGAGEHDYFFENSTIADETYHGAKTAQELCHRLASISGWWNDKATGLKLRLDQVNIPEKLALIHSEVSEALDGHRKDSMDKHLPHRRAIEVELSDALARIYDLGGFLGLDLAGALVEKLAYNQSRTDTPKNSGENCDKAY